MAEKKINIWMITLFLAVSPPIWAQAPVSTTYTLTYHEDSPVKNVPLANTTVKVELYKYSLPRGVLEVNTDAKQVFVLDDAYDLEVTYVKNEDQYHARCSGYATVQDTTIKITCSRSE